MKSKKLPKIVILFLTLFAFNIGFIIGPIVFHLNLLAWIFGFFILFIVFLLLHIRYRLILEEWGLIEPPKKKERGRNKQTTKKRSA